MTAASVCRYIYLDGREALPDQVKSMVFGNPVEMAMKAMEMWEFHSFHADMAFNFLERQQKKIHEKHDAEMRKIKVRVREKLQLHSIVLLLPPDEGSFGNYTPEYQLSSRVAMSQLKEPRVMKVDTRECNSQRCPSKGW